MINYNLIMISIKTSGCDTMKHLCVSLTASLNVISYQ